MSEEIIKECLIVLKKNLEVSGLKEIPPRILKSTVKSCQLNSKTFFSEHLPKARSDLQTFLQRISNFKVEADM